jgi:hypothetical protein
MVAGGVLAAPPVTLHVAGCAHERETERLLVLSVHERER